MYWFFHLDTSLLISENRMPLYPRVAGPFQFTHGQAAVEQRDMVTASRRGFHDVPADEYGAAEDEDVQGALARNVRRVMILTIGSLL